MELLNVKMGLLRQPNRELIFISEMLEGLKYGHAKRQDTSEGNRSNQRGKEASKMPPKASATCPFSLQDAICCTFIKSLIKLFQYISDASVSFHSINNSWEYLQLSYITDKNCQLNLYQHSVKERQPAKFTVIGCAFPLLLPCLPAV